MYIIELTSQVWHLAYWFWQTLTSLLPWLAI